MTDFVEMKFIMNDDEKKTLPVIGDTVVRIF